MAYTFEDLARNSPRLPSDLDSSKARPHQPLSSDRQAELLEILDQEERSQIALDHVAVVVVRHIILIPEKSTTN